MSGHDSIHDISLDARRAYLMSCLNITVASRAVIKEYGKSGFTVSKKSDRSVVTAVDTAVETALREAILKEFPTHGIKGEEFPAHNCDADFQWIIDPIDGTEQFIAGIPTFGTIISLYYKNEPLAGLIDHPALDVTTYAGAGLGIYCNGARLEQPCSGRQQKERNVRIATAKRENFMRWSDDSAVFDAIVRGYPSFWVFDNCYSHTAVLSGAADAMVDYNVRFWDVSPLKVLVEEAGGVFQCLRRAERTDGAVSYSVVFGVPEVVRELAAIYEEYMAKKRDT